MSSGRRYICAYVQYRCVSICIHIMHIRMSATSPSPRRTRFLLMCAHLQLGIMIGSMRCLCSIRSGDFYQSFSPDTHLKLADWLGKKHFFSSHVRWTPYFLCGDYAWKPGATIVNGCLIPISTEVAGFRISHFLLIPLIWSKLLRVYRHQQSRYGGILKVF